MDTGAIMACGYSSDSISRCVDAAIEQNKNNIDSLSFVPADYCIKNTSQRVVNLIISTAHLSNDWDGIRE